MPTKTKSPKITIKQARRVLEIVDAGLCSGVGRPEPGKMCVEAAVCFALGEPHGDQPTCVAPIVRNFKIALNDSAWSSDTARAKGLRRIAIAQLGSAGINEKAFVTALAEQTIRLVVPAALRASAGMKGNAAHKDALLAAADRCEKEGSYAASDAARAAARAASDAARAAARAARAASDAASYAARAAARAASDAARAAASDAASDAARAASYAASDAASDAARAASYAASDAMLTLAAEAGVQALKMIGAAGIKLLNAILP